MARQWERRFKQPADGNPAFENLQPELLQLILSADMEEAQFHAMVAQPRMDPNDRRIVPVPHDDVELYAAEIDDTHDLRLVEGVFP